MERAAIALTGDRIRAEARAGGPSPASSVLKWKMSEQLKQRYELLVTILGARGVGWEGDGFTEEELRIAREWAFAKIHAIGGGTTEIQLNIIAKRVLDLPD
jgi:alkylation response protein AidB-like acyl-CoA dehydrogenase